MRHLRNLKNVVKLMLFYAVTAMALAACGNSGGNGGTAPSASSFSQDDLTGNWYFMQFFSGPDVTAGTHRAWMRGTVTIDAKGKVTTNTIQDSTGTATVLPAGTITQTIDANGVVTEGGSNGAGTGNHAFMTANKQIVVGTRSSGNGKNQGLCIFVRQGVVSFSPPDISSGTFAYNQLKTGGNNGWQFGTGTINASQQVTLNTLLDNNGNTTPPPANFLTLAITTAGIVTNTGAGAESTFQGVMTPDKKLIIGTETSSGGNSYNLRIITIGGQTFTTADMAGIWKFSQLETSPLWEYGTSSFSSAGVGTQLSFLDSTGSTTSGGAPTFSVGSTGLVTMAGVPSFHGVMAFNKNILVGTVTTTPGVFSMNIAVK